jgi:phosphatidylglycerol:prolipoprotein diacylglycerol transferase
MGVEYVEFPYLGLRVPVRRELFRIFGLGIYTYAVIIAAALVVMILLGVRASGRFGLLQDNVIDMMILALPLSIICARLYYVAFSWSQYKGDDLAIVNIRQGGLAIYGAVIGAFLAVTIYTKAKKIRTLAMLDFGVPYLALGQCIGRWGNFVNQEAFGANTTLPWGMTSDAISRYLAANAKGLGAIGMFVDPAIPVHPTFLYESVWDLLVAVLLFRMRKTKRFHGSVTLWYLIAYGAGRAFIEGLRADSLLLGTVRVSQALSILLVIVCFVAFVLSRGRAPAELPPAMLAVAGAGGEAPAGGEAETAATEGEAAPSDSDGEAAPAASEGEAAPPASEDEAAPAASEGEAGPAASEGEAAPPASEGEAGPAATEGEAAPAAPEGEAAPPASEGEAETAASEGEAAPPASEGEAPAGGDRG